ncbi:hypothetical protein BLNAU_16532 [Blattamonas nauphoetae]|uniref:GSKIP domain-containing protein n=1 Tax=Blattamonas nauphoetae TaxID=2049346 RepID=A0ABQ9X885_9EUKA|nr:hypothetical protein BLNAU_16532 [Blattamonas nauphoetae]
MFIDEELNEITHNYKNYITSFSVKEKEGYTATFSLITLENESCDIFLSPEGYKILSGPSKDKIYESFDTLLLNISPMFIERRNAKFAEMIQALANEQLSSNTD